MAKSTKESAFEFLMKEITPKSEEITIKGRKFEVINRATRSDELIVYRLMAETMAQEKLKPNSEEWKSRPVNGELQNQYDEAFKSSGFEVSAFKNYYEAVLSIMSMQFLLNIISVTSLHEDGKQVARTEAMIKGLIESLDQKTLNEIHSKVTLLNKKGEELAEKN